MILSRCENVRVTPRSSEHTGCDLIGALILCVTGSPGKTGSTHVLEPWTAPEWKGFLFKNGAGL